MRVRVRRHRPHQALGIIALVAIPLAAGAGPVLLFFSGTNRMADVFINCYYNTTRFGDVNYSLLASMAAEFEDRLVKYHIPLNFTCTTFFETTNYSAPTWYGGGGDTAIQTGLGLATQCFRYATYVKEGDPTAAAESLAVVRRLMDGVAMLLAVPNGGIGPEYSGILARVVSPPPHTLAGPLRGLSLGKNNFNGSGIYSQWRWDGNPSKDQHSGVIFGLGMVLRFITADVAPDIREQACKCVDQLAHGFLQTDWAGIDGNGVPTGVDMSADALGGSEWVLGILRLAATAYPAKYAALYHHYCTSEFYLNRAKGGSGLNTMMDYYANVFNWHVYGALLLLEDNPAIKAVYLAKFIEPFWREIRFHRNAYFNAMYLMVTGQDNATIRHDLCDQLMQFSSNRFPERNNNFSAVPTWYSKTSADFLASVFEKNPFSTIFRSIPGVFNKLEDSYFTQPRTVDAMQYDWFIWQRNPFSVEDSLNNFSSRNTGSIESHGLAFTAPYWVARWAGMIPPTGYAPKGAFK